MYLSGYINGLYIEFYWNYSGGQFIRNIFLNNSRIFNL